MFKKAAWLRFVDAPSSTTSAAELFGRLDRHVQKQNLGRMISTQASECQQALWIAQDHQSQTHNAGCLMRVQLNHVAHKQKHCDIWLAEESSFALICHPAEKIRITIQSAMQDTWAAKLESMLERAAWYEIAESWMQESSTVLNEHGLGFGRACELVGEGRTQIKNQRIDRDAVRSFVQRGQRITSIELVLPSPLSLVIDEAMIISKIASLDAAISLKHCQEQASPQVSAWAHLNRGLVALASAMTKSNATSKSNPSPVNGGLKRTSVEAYVNQWTS